MVSLGDGAPSEPAISTGHQPGTSAAHSPAIPVLFCIDNADQVSAGPEQVVGAAPDSAAATGDARSSMGPPAAVPASSASLGSLGAGAPSGAWYERTLPQSWLSPPGQEGGAADAPSASGALAIFMISALPFLRNKGANFGHMLSRSEVNCRNQGRVGRRATWSTHRDLRNICSSWCSCSTGVQLMWAKAGCLDEMIA